MEKREKILVLALFAILLVVFSLYEIYPGIFSGHASRSVKIVEISTKDYPVTENLLLEYATVSSIISQLYTQSSADAIDASHANLIIAGIATKDITKIDSGFSSIESIFSRQHPDGYLYSQSIYPIDQQSLFISSVIHSFMLLNSSDYSSIYSSRMKSLDKNIAKSMDWIAANDNSLKLQHINSTSRQLEDATLFILAGIYLSSQEYYTVGKSLINNALSRQSNTGMFYEQSISPSLQASSIYNLELQWLWIKEQAVRDAVYSKISDAVDWQKGYVEPSSCVVSTQSYPVDYKIIIHSLAYWFAIDADADSGRLATKCLSRL